MFLKRQNHSRKQFLGEALGFSVSWPTREKGRKEVEMNRGILRGGETAT